jgi:pimeloyl-ACP methyl ester carboxylesterase
MELELIQIKTNTIPLDGLLYSPTNQTPKGVVMICHGNTMNFYVGASRFLPPALCEMGYACLSFNRRGHDILGIRDSRIAEGAAFQTTAEGIEDNEYAANWLLGRGYELPILVGHSNGGFLAVQHVVNNPKTPALVLLSAHSGGRGAEKLAAKTGLLGGNKTSQMREKAENMIAEGRGDDLMFLPGWWYVATAKSYIDRLTTMPDTVKSAAQVHCPVFFIRGDQEIREAYPAEDFAANCSGSCDVKILEDCDHFYRGKEDVVTEQVCNWLSENL